MNNTVEFIFMGVAHNCDIFIDTSTDPRYIFVILHDKELVTLFGNDITIKTDFEKWLPHDDDHGKLKALKRAVFGAVQVHPEFIEAKNKLYQYKERLIHNYK